MEIVVLGVWVIQSAVGLTLFVGWLRHAHGRGARTVVTHAVLMLSGLAVWIWFVMTGALAVAWGAFAVITAGNIFGDAMLLGRARRIAPEARSLSQRYGVAIAGIFRGQIPPRVGFHAFFAAAPWFTCLGVCIGATVAAAS